MLIAHTVAQVRAAEERVIARIGSDALMQRAAAGLAERLSFIPSGQRVLMLIGPGNNGGDALYAAAALVDRGVHVDLCLVDEHNVHRGGWDAALAAGAQHVDEPGSQPWVVDAMFGIGARAPLQGRAAQLAAGILGAHVIAVDVPSGIDVDGGTVPGTAGAGAAVRATRTVTFGTYKPGLVVSPAAEHAGRDVAHCVDIGLTSELGRPAVEAIEPGDARLLADYLITGDTGPRAVHKYSRGVVGVAAGSNEYAGAAHLTVAGAQTGPAGMVRFFGDSALTGRVVDRAPEVVAGRGRVQAWVVGPGGGQDASSAVASVLADGLPTVIDADGLAHLPAEIAVPAVLTPHAGELAQMLDTSRENVEADPVTYGRRASDQWNTTVLLKGKRTCVFTPGQPVRVNISGTPWLATAGSGDVLAGLIGSMLAAGLPPHEAASVSAFVHGAAAVRANPSGPVTASHVAAALPGVIAEFLAGSMTDVRRW